MRFLIGILLITIIFTISACSVSKVNLTPQQEADMLYAKAKELQGLDMLDEANMQFEEYARKYPESKRADNAKLQVANSYFQQEKYDQALSTYQEIIDQYPESDSADNAMLAIGDIYFIQKRYDDAVESYNKILQKYSRLGTDVAVKARNRINAIGDLEIDIKILSEGKDEEKDNAQYDIGDIYFSVFSSYKYAIEEFQKVLDRWPKSELADDALLRIGECYWNIASMQIPSADFTPEHRAYISLQEYYERFPQLMKIEQFKLDAHWPAKQESQEYRNAYYQVRRIVNKYPGIQDKKTTDFISEDYKKAFEKWQEIIYTYSYTDKAVEAPARIAKGFVDLGNLYYNLGEKHFAGLLFKESLRTMPTPAGHLGLARYYGNMTSTSPSAWAYRRAFFHINEAMKLTPPDSPMADRVSWAKEWMNYKMRIEGLEQTLFEKSGKRR